MIKPLVQLSVVESPGSADKTLGDVFEGVEICRLHVGVVTRTAPTELEALDVLCEF